MEFDSQTDILALDFDGVIVDSIKECLVSGYNAYANFTGDENISSYEELDSKWASEARRLRNFIRNGEDYVFIAHALHEDRSIQNQHEFDEFLNENSTLQDTFFDHMYNQRIAFSKAFPQKWGELNPLYEGMRDFLNDFPQKQNLYLITTKKLVFVHKTLEAWDVKLQRDNIRDTSGDVSKRQIIEGILTIRMVAPQQFYFVDDQVDTLFKIKPTGVNTILAAWGYNNEAQLQKAKQGEIPVLELKEFMQQFGENQSPR